MFHYYAPGPKIHRWGIWKLAVNGKCLMNVCGLRLLCRGRPGSQISLQGKPGRPINAFKSKLQHLCPKLFTSTNKRGLLQALIRTHIFKCFHPGGIIFHLCQGSRKGWAEDWIRHSASVWHCGFKSKLWLPIYTERSQAFVVSCCILVRLCFGFCVCLRRAADGVSVSLHSAFHTKIRILQSLTVGRFYWVH